jgi:formylglycine-generating enzyme required for sulfatase activity
MEITLEAGAEPVPGYRLVERLGRGGCGEVWKAIGPGGFELALKSVCLAESIGPLELRGLQIIKDIRHPHLLATFGAWQVGRYLIIAMELAERTLLDRFRETAGQGFPGIPAPEIHEHFLDAARGLDYLNEPRHPSGGAEPVGIQHRDVKPQNLLLVGGSVKVADFGLARILEHTQTSHTGSMTPAYAAPEFFKKQTSSQSDQYSLAVTYCHLRGGRLPFTGGMAEIMAGHLLEPPDLTMLPEGEREAAARALAKEPRDRWGSCRAFVEALRSGVTAQDRVASTTGPAGSPACGTFRPGEAREASSSAEGPGRSVSPGRPAPVSPPAHWGARPEVHPRRSLTAMSDRGRRVLVGSLAGLSLVIVLGLGALGVFALRGRPPGTPGPAPIAPSSDTRSVGPVTAVPPESSRPPGPMAAAPAPPPAPERAPALSPDVPASEPGSATSAAPPAKSGAAPGGGAPAPAPTATPSTPSATLVKAEGRGTLKGQVVFDGDAPAAPPSQEPQPQRPQPQPRRDWTNSIGMKLARIEPGSFLMGSTDGTGYEDEHPQHEVRITRPFYLGVTEVTQAQYEAVMDSNPSWFASTGQGKDKVAGQSTSQHPVENVSWLDAVKFCNKLSELEGRKPFYEIDEGTARVPDWKASGYRLPTEAEWEYACGGDPADLNEHAWFGGNSGSVTHPVGKKLTNRFGLHDMHGNVWEWCWDAYDKDYYKQSPPDDPPGPSQASSRVFRGGSWFSDPRGCRSAIRSGSVPDDRIISLGFRLAAVQE